MSKLNEATSSPPQQDKKKQKHDDRLLNTSENRSLFQFL